MPASLAGEGLCILGHWNCTRRPASTNPFGDNDLRISALSLAAPQQRDPGTDLQYLAAVHARLDTLGGRGFKSCIANLNMRCQEMSGSLFH